MWDVLFPEANQYLLVLERTTIAVVCHAGNHTRSPGGSLQAIHGRAQQHISGGRQHHQQRTQQAPRTGKLSISHPSNLL